MSRVFGNVTNSYKFLFFLALLEGCQQRLFQEPLVLSLDELLLDMLVLAWYPHVYFKLSFGKVDQLARELDRMPVSSLGPKFVPWDKRSVRSGLTLSKTAFELVRYVPFRLIRPFLKSVGSPKDHLVNGLVKEAAEKYFFEEQPLYKISQDDRLLTMHPNWLRYVKANFSIVRGWACWQYLQYMEKANPLVPNLASKLFPPAERESLKQQTDYWNVVAASSDVRCIYTDKLLEPGAFALDHFLPWSFVVHNELWNLVPVDPVANSSKSDKLPSEAYLDSFLAVQQNGLTTARAALTSKQWHNCANIFALRLNLTGDDWVDSTRFPCAFRELLATQLQLAELNGFEKGWRFGKQG